MRQTQLCAHMQWGVQGGLHTVCSVCVAHGGLAACPACVWAWGSGVGRSLSVQR